MTEPMKPVSTVVTNAQIEAAADAMRIIYECDEARRAGGVPWWCLAQVALEAAEELRGKAVCEAPGVSQ